MRVIVSGNLTEEEVQALNGATVFDPDTLDEAIVGVFHGPGGVVAAYSYDLLVEHFEQEMGEESAMEWVDYNVVRAVPYMGERAPKILAGLWWNEDDEAAIIEVAGRRWVAMC